MNKNSKWSKLFGLLGIISASSDMVCTVRVLSKIYYPTGYPTEYLTRVSDEGIQREYPMMVSDEGSIRRG